MKCQSERGQDRVNEREQRQRHTDTDKDEGGDHQSRTSINVC